MTDKTQLTRLINDWRSGDAALMERIVPQVYDELHRVARYYMRKQPASSTLQATALINEAFLRLGDIKNQINDRGHFIGIVSRLMRNVIVDYVRASYSLKRGGQAHQVSIDDTNVATFDPSIDVLALEAVLETLEKKDPRKVRAVELCYFCGMTNPEAAAALEISEATLQRELAMVKAILKVKLGE